MIVSVAVAALIAFVSGLGVGGGGLFATYLAIFTPLSQVSVQGYNLLFFLFCAGASVCVQLIKRKRISILAVAIMTLAGMCGSVLGSYMTLVLPEEYLRKIFGGMLTVTGIVSLRKQYSKKCPTETDRTEESATESARNGDEKGR